MLWGVEVSMLPLGSHAAINDSAMRYHAAGDLFIHKLLEWNKHAFQIACSQSHTFVFSDKSDPESNAWSRRSELFLECLREIDFGLSVANGDQTAMSTCSFDAVALCVTHGPPGDRLDVVTVRTVRPPVVTRRTRQSWWRRRLGREQRWKVHNRLVLMWINMMHDWIWGINRYTASIKYG